MVRSNLEITRNDSLQVILDLTKALEIEPSNKSVKDELSKLPVPTPKKEVSIQRCRICTSYQLMLILGKAQDREETTPYQDCG